MGPDGNERPDISRDLLKQRAGQALQTLRLLKGLTQEQLGEKVGITTSSISQLERGLIYPQFPVLAKLIEALDADANIFFGRQTKTLSNEDNRLVAFLSSLSEEEKTALHAGMEVLLLALRNT
jgi:transcriptional regulator with XRE-family HTH domain